MCFFTHRTPKPFIKIWRSSLCSLEYGPYQLYSRGTTPQSLLQETWKFIAKKIDETGDMIMKELESFSYNDLLALDDAHIELATVNHPEQKRG